MEVQVQLQVLEDLEVEVVKIMLEELVMILLLVPHKELLEV